MRAPALLFVVVLSASAWSMPSPDRGEFTGRVVSVSDGDTLTVLTAGKRQVKIRLASIDCPETGQDFGTRAKQAASDLAFGRDVTIRPVETDRYGRTVAVLILPDGRSMNHELVREGMAWWYRTYAPNDRELERLESEARTAKRGLWAVRNPVPPWEWRRPKADPTGAVIGNRSSRLFHTSNCPNAARMKASNRVTFKSAKEAESGGYRKAKDCK